MSEYLNDRPQITAPMLTAEDEQFMTAQKNQACFFTGHRNIPKKHMYELSDLLNRQIEAMVYHGFTVFYSGAARGFDLLAAAAVLKVRQTSPDIRLMLIIPCPQQTRGWNEEDRQLYAMICSRGEKRMLSAAYDKGCMHKRNRFLVDHAVAGLAYCSNSSRGGTVQTLHYAEASHVPVINLASMIEVKKTDES